MISYSREHSGKGTGIRYSECGGISRYHEDNGNVSILRDIHNSVDLSFNWITIHRRKPIQIAAYNEVVEARESHQFGKIVRFIREKKPYTLWYPHGPVVIENVNEQHIKYSDINSQIFSKRNYFSFDPIGVGEDGDILISYVLIKDEDGTYFRDITTISDVEKRCYLKSNWFRAEYPHNLWNYLVNGSLYDPKYSRITGMRYKCQQCAYSWWNYCKYLFLRTGKLIYRLLCDEIAFSIYNDMKPCGEWKHGVWSDSMETHARFQIDGLHLLLSQYHLSGNSDWLEPLYRGTNYLLENLSERLDQNMIWFLHDTFESSKNHKFTSHLFGKKSGNSLCLNTHAQALGYLQRYLSLKINVEYYTSVSGNGKKALQALLEKQPNDFLYLFLLNRIIAYKNRLYSDRKLIRGFAKYESRLLNNLFWFVRSRYPRLVFPQGFTERDITLSYFSDRYHVINMKDLLLLYRLDDYVWLKEYIIGGLAFIEKYINQLGKTTVLKSSPYYIELIDVYSLYAKYIDSAYSHMPQDIEQSIVELYGGTSLDYYLIQDDLI
jgi:hypothetical protein